ncbi:hypothetical protein SAMN06265222_11643 [Neorhodopirellula lusitana]|uniref:Uncharacterized protein n=1 Tax=Neorhodopirellula lusitana TaxID=445327 RepID=A0ABY1QK65_9BACT|nr:hypothetical protein [Neorhodopirellula lusitana]SMP73172.1 hypothetical protein SAMN06265222_11643 [Neorhodopirellula lusitana]
MATQPTPARSIEQLKSEYEQLNERKIQAQTQLEEAEKQLKKLQEESEAEFGTSDIDELTKKLEEMEAENEKQRSDYQALLDQISQDLEKVESGKATPATAETDTLFDSDS